MSERRTVSVTDGAGAQWWFRIDDATRWASTTSAGGELFRVGGRWVMWDELAAIGGLPARLVDDQGALEWLCQNGHEPADELLKYASARQLR